MDIDSMDIDMGNGEGPSNAPPLFNPLPVNPPEINPRPTVETLLDKIKKVESEEANHYGAKTSSSIEMTEQSTLAFQTPATVQPSTLDSQTQTTTQTQAMTQPPIRGFQKLSKFPKTIDRIWKYVAAKPRIVIVKFHPDARSTFSPTPPPVGLHVDRTSRSITLPFMQVLQPFKEHAPIYFSPDLDTIEICGAVDHDRPVFLASKLFSRNYTLETFAHSAVDAYGTAFTKAVQSIQRIYFTWSSFQRMKDFWCPKSTFNKLPSTDFTGILNFTSLQVLCFEVKPSVLLIEGGSSSEFDFQETLGVELYNISRKTKIERIPIIIMHKGGQRKIVFNEAIYNSVVERHERIDGGYDAVYDPHHRPRPVFENGRLVRKPVQKSPPVFPILRPL